MTEVTGINHMESDDPLDAKGLVALLYDELRQLAGARLAQENPGQTLQATALVHEAFLRLGGERSFASRSHFLRAAAIAMRRILIDRARARRAEKRGGDGQRVPADDLEAPRLDADLIDLDEALNKLAVEDSLAAQVVELHHFAGLSHDQVAETLEITVYVARQKWNFARAWLKAEMDS